VAPCIWPILVTFTVLAVAPVTAAASPQAQDQPPNAKPDLVVAPAEYVIGPNDVLTITLVSQDPRFSGDVTVRPDGKIALLVIGEIQAAGLTLVQLKAELTSAYAKHFQAPVVLVSPKQINSRTVTVAGMVHKPGAYRLNDSMNVLQLIVKAGGLLAGADKDSIQILRRHPDGKTETIPFNLTKLFEDRLVTKIPELRPGDQVTVR
jgi:polysaccharide export outer membrane protein